MMATYAYHPTSPTSHLHHFEVKTESVGKSLCIYIIP